MANAIYKKLWIVILLPLLAAGIAWFLTWEKSGQYKSTAVVEASLPSFPTTETKTLKDIPGPDQYYENLIATMKTELITSMVSYRLLMHDLEGEIAFRPPAIQYTGNRRNVIRKKLESKLSSFELLSEADATEQTINQVIHNMDYDIARWLREEEILISRKPGSNRIDITVLAEDPFLSAFTANTLGQEYIRYELEIASPPVSDTSDSTSYFREEAERFRKEVEQKSGELKEAQSAQKAPADDVRFRRARSNRIAEYEMRIVEEEWEINSLREQLSRLQAAPAPTVDNNAGPVDVASSAKIQTIRKKIDQLTRIYKDGGSKDTQLDSIIHRLKDQVNLESARLQQASRKTITTPQQGSHSKEREMLTLRLARHEETIRGLRNDVRKLKQAVPSSAGNSGVIAKLEKEYQSAEVAYNNALAELRREESKTVKPAEAPPHHLILKSKALPSAKPESPYTLLIIFGSFLVTLILCIVIIALTRPAPKVDDSIFLRVNYANRKPARRNKEDLNTATP